MVLGKLIWIQYFRLCSLGSSHPFWACFSWKCLQSLHRTSVICKLLEHSVNFWKIHPFVCTWEGKGGSLIETKYLSMHSLKTISKLFLEKRNLIGEKEKREINALNTCHYVLLHPLSSAHALGSDQFIANAIHFK